MTGKTRFHDEWFEVYKYPMPPHVERLSIMEIQQAIEFGRRKHQPVSEPIGNNDSMMDYDNHKQH